jgi:hypothetical protein
MWKQFIGLRTEFSVGLLCKSNKLSDYVIDEYLG